MRHPTPLPHALHATPFTAAQARAAGVPPHRLRASDLHAPFRGVRMPVGDAADFLERCRAYAQTMPDDHLFSSVTAARFWGLPLPRVLQDDPRVHVTATGGGRAPRGRGVVGHSTELAVSYFERDALRFALPVDAWCDLSTVLALDDLIAAGDRLLGLPTPLATLAQVDAAIRRRSGCRGARALRSARLEMRPRVYSARETVARLAVTRAGLPEPEPNGVIRLGNGRRLRGDLVFRRYRVLLEYEGEHHLFDRRQWASDLTRYNDLAQDGWLVIRVTKAMSRADLVARTTRALRSRGWTG